MTSSNTVNKTDLTNVYLILDGNKISNKKEFLTEIGLLLKFPEYYDRNYDALDECLGDIIDIWTNNNPTVIEHIISPFTSVIDAVDKGLQVNIIWVNSELFFNDDSEAYYTAVNILRDANKDKTTPLNFYLGTYIY